MLRHCRFACRLDSIRAHIDGSNTAKLGHVTPRISTYASRYKPLCMEPSGRRVGAPEFELSFATQGQGTRASQPRHQIHISANAEASAASLGLVLGGIFSNPTELFDFDPRSRDLARAPGPRRPESRVRSCLHSPNAGAAQRASAVQRRCRQSALGLHARGFCQPRVSACGR